MKLRHAALALALAAGLTACGSDEALTAVPSSASSAVTVVASAGTFSEAEYLELVRSGTDFWDVADDQKVLDSSQLVCDVLEASMTDDQFFNSYLNLLKSSTSNGMSAREAGAYVTYATAQFCPKQMQRIDNLPGA